MVALPLGGELSEGRRRFALLDTGCGITPSRDLPADVLGPPAGFIKSEVRETPERDDALPPVAVSAIPKGPGLRAGARNPKLQTLLLGVAMLFLRLVRLDALHKARS